MYSIYAIVEENVPAWMQWRIVQPFAKLRKASVGIGTWLINNNIEDITAIEPGSIVVFPRIAVQRHEREETLKWMQELRKGGIIFIYECDDDIFSEHYAAQVVKVTLQENAKMGSNAPKQAISWLMNEVELRREATLWTAQQCDAITCSSESLAMYIGALLEDKDVYVIPNAIDVLRFVNGGSGVKVSWVDKISIGWAGGSRPESDLQILGAAWTEIAKRYDDVVFVNSGWQSQVLKNSVPDDKYIHHKWTEFERYSVGMKVTIGCCAVQDNEFTRRKTPIKAWEYTLMGAATVGSRPLYNGECSLIAETVQDWVYSIQKLIDDTGFRAESVKYNTKHVLDYHNLSNEYVRWEATYDHIWNTYMMNKGVVHALER